MVLCSGGLHTTKWGHCLTLYFLIKFNKFGSILSILSISPCIIDTLVVDIPTSLSKRISSMIFPREVEMPEENLISGMRRLNGVYTQMFNRRHRRVGHLFQGRYKSIIVDRESYLLELSRYVVLNTVRAGIVDKPEQWECSG